MHEDYERAALLQRLEQGGLLRGSADDLGRPLLDELTDRPVHLKSSSLKSLGSFCHAGTSASPRVTLVGSSSTSKSIDVMPARFGLVATALKSSLFANVSIASRLAQV